LEALVEEKTAQLSQEKRRSEELLYQVLPRWDINCRLAYIYSLFNDTFSSLDGIASNGRMISEYMNWNRCGRKQS
jgi:hypothetical protein